MLARHPRSLPLLESDLVRVKLCVRRPNALMHIVHQSGGGQPAFYYYFCYDTMINSIMNANRIPKTLSTNHLFELMVWRYFSN